MDQAICGLVVAVGSKVLCHSAVSMMGSKAAKELDLIKDQCDKASEKGLYGISIAAHMYIARRLANADLAKRLLLQNLKGLGFSKILVPDFSHSSTILRIEISWKDVSRVSRISPEPPAKRLKGHTGTCQVCEERGSMVVLVPCGHVLCRDCRDSQAKRNQNCPFCRQHVTCATDGLFFNWVPSDCIAVLDLLS